MTLPLALQDMVAPGEPVLGHWRPALGQFLKGFVIAGGLTSLLLGPLTLPQGPLVFLATLILGVAIYGFIFDDIFVWRARRADHWVLTDRQLLFCNDRGDDNPAALPLDQIKGFAGTAWMGLTLRLTDGTKLRMSYVPAPRAIRAAIEAAQSR